MNTTTPATQKQIDFVKTLLGELAEVSPEGREWARHYWFLLRETEEAGLFTAGAASQTISDVKETKKFFQARAPKAEQSQSEFNVPSGRYAVDAEDGHTAFYKVNVTDYGKTFVDLQVTDGFVKIGWAQAKAVLRKIEADGIREATIRYGHELGVCGICGRTLTDEASRAAGIGPICSQK